MKPEILGWSLKLSSIEEANELQIKYFVDGECWRYVGPHSTTGYPQIVIDKKRHQLRRVLFENLIGPIAQGKEVKSTCGNRWCIRWEHLLINPARVYERKRPFTHCLHGHELTDENVYVQKSGKSCKQCRKDQYRSRKAGTVNE